MLIGSPPAFAQKTNTTAAGGSGGSGGKTVSVAKPFADITVATDIVEWGISQTEQTIGIKAGFGYQWDQFKLGFTGTNVRFPDSEDSSNLRLNAAYVFPMSPNVDLTITVSFNNYFKSASRNGEWKNVDLQMFGYHVKYNAQDNFEATGYQKVRYGFGKVFDFYKSTMLDVEFGYNDTQGARLKNFIDISANWLIPWQEIYWGIGAAANTQPADYPRRAGFLVFVSAGVKF